MTDINGSDAVAAAGRVLTTPAELRAMTDQDLTGIVQTLGTIGDRIRDMRIALNDELRRRHAARAAMRAHLEAGSAEATGNIPGIEIDKVGG